MVIIFAMIVAGHAQKNPFIVVTTKATPLPSISPAPSTSPSAAPTKVLNRGEMSNLYGPCIELPIILYHHIEPMSVAQQKKHTSLNIDSEVFRKQMEYLKQKGYSSVTPADLVAFFDEGMQLPSKPVMITFDDGYDDNGEYAYEILKQVGIKGVIFLPTGLMQN
ncbi:MAG: putative xylanase/chitin deacetilase, partial [Candidatus Collierbacteria bacterium GW2011_GWF2_44_15]